MQTKLNPLVVLLFVIGSTTLHAQSLQNDFDEELFFKDIGATVMLQDGTVKEMQAFYHPLLMSSPHVNLGPFDTNPNLPGTPKSEFKAIFIAGDLWLPRATSIGNSWVVMKKQGAIERYLYILNGNVIADVLEEKMSRDLVDEYKNRDIPIVSAIATAKLNHGATIDPQMMVSFSTKMAEMTSDYEELSSKISNKESGYKFLNINKVIDEYNTWYEEQHPGAITTITAEDLGIEQVKSVKEAVSQLKQLKEDHEKKAAAAKASRPAEPGPEVASAKPNMPEKKESFTEKINRIKADGNKVGIHFVNPCIYIKPMATSSFGKDAGVRDTLVAFPTLEKFAQSFTDEMNKAFNTDVFELVDISQIPYKEVSMMGKRLVDDWWSTKYKLVLTYSINTFYELMRTDAQIEGFFRALPNVTATEFVNGEKPNEQEIIVRSRSMGFYAKTLKDVGLDAEIEDIGDIEETMNGEVSEPEVYEFLADQRTKKLEKFIKKMQK